MTGRGRNTVRIEADIEKSREESAWKKVIELAEQLKIRSPANECLSNFLIGEGKLESYLEEWPPIEANFTKAKQGLAEARSFLLLAANELGKKAGVALDAHLLLGKLNYASGMFSESLKNYTLAELHALTEKQLPIRSLRIVAESYAIKGLCLELSVITGGSRYKQAERENDMIRCFELASELSLLYLQRAEGSGGSGTGSVVGMQNTHTNTVGSGSNINNAARALGPVLETVLQRSPILHMQSGRLQRAVERYREMLTAVESSGTHSLRLTLARQLAEVLLRGVSGSEWTPPNTKPGDGPWKPKKYTGLNQFIPRNDCEETILLLLIGEAMAVRDAVLSQSPEFKQARIHAFENASAIYDLLTIATVRWGQVGLLQESLDRAMKFSFGEAHVWTQQAYSLVTLGRSTRAVGVLIEVIKLNSTAVVPCLMAARQCYEALNRISEGLKYSEMALQREHEHPTYMLSRCHLYVGIGHLMSARTTTVRADKATANNKCLESFRKAVDCDPNDHLGLYYLSLQCALMGKLAEAIVHVRVCLEKRSECSAAMQLLCLLLSARGRTKEALSTATAALEDHPDSMDLLRILALLQLRCQGGEIALETGKRMLTVWKSLYENRAVNELPNDFDKKSETRSVLQLYNDRDSTKDSSSLQANSLAASRVERALSSAASSVGTPSGSAEPGSQGGPLLRLRVWLLLAELYLAVGSPQSASACVSEAASIFPLSHHVMYMRGMVHAHKQEWIEARQCFQNAVAINPSHVDSLVQLGLCHHYLGSQRLAEKLISDAAKLEPNNHITWFSLGLVLESLEEYDTASNCFATALNVDLSSPVLPFTSIAYIFE